jgi:hypothetical protein
MSTMTLIRTSANRIASFVVRYASAGSKEWAQAIASELNCIENDWQALGWALGGLRVLFSIQPAPLHSLEDLHEAARKHANRRLHAVNNGWFGTNAPLFAPIVACFSVLLQLAMHRQIASNAVQLTGWLLLFPTTYLRSREPNVPDLDDRANLVRFYADEMAVLSRNSVSFFMLVAGLLFLICGWAMDFAHSPVIIAIITLVWLPVLMLVLANHVNHRRRYAQIKALLGAPSNI